MKYDVFISYSRKDTTIADQICEAFDTVGITYFIDRQGIGGGMEFPKVIAPAIRESEVFLLLASQNAYDSPFTDREITFAFNKKRGEKMLPYIIDNTPLPEHLELIFSSNNWRILRIHPIETVLVDDVLFLLGRARPNTPIVTTPQPSIQPTPILESTPIQKSSTSKPTSIKLEKRQGKYGLIDEYGNTVLPFEYDDVGFYNDFGVRVNGYRMKKNGQWFVIDIDLMTGKKSPKEISRPTKSRELGKQRKLEKRSGYYGVIDEYGNIIIPFEYDDVGFYNDFGVRVNGYRMKKNRRWYTITQNGEIIG